jgi:hypothetical protein
VGHVFGFLTVLERVDGPDTLSAHWGCLCACGTYVVARAPHLRTGARKTCGCKNLLEPYSSGPLGVKILEALRSCGPMTAPALATLLGEDFVLVRDKCILLAARKPPKKLLYVQGWSSEPTALEMRSYPRPVYAAGDKPNAEKLQDPVPPPPEYHPLDLHAMSSVFALGSAIGTRTQLDKEHHAADL